MNYGIFSVYDTKGLVYSQPFYSANRATALRQFEDLINNTPHLRDHAGDYILTRLGEFDDSSGDIIPQPADGDAQIANGSAVLTKEV